MSSDSNQMMTTKRVNKVCAADQKLVKTPEIANAIDKILNVVADLQDAPEIRNSWVSDESWLSDFWSFGKMSPRDLYDVSEALGIIVDNPHINLWALAAKLVANN